MYDVAIVGAGIVGLASAKRLLEARPGTRIVVLEKEAGVGRHQTGNNSGVIHAGLYYKPGSLKARLCREGYTHMLRFCEEEGVAHEICGKLVVATDAPELPRLQELLRRGGENGLAGLRVVGGDEIREIEPHCAGIQGIFVPQTGIVDYGVVAERCAARISLQGAEVVLGARVESIRSESHGALLETTSGDRRAKVVISCAGLHSDRLARQTQADLPFRIVPFRGEYYVLRPEARRLVRNLIYPVPNPDFPFLGVHFTRMISGDVECGPNAVLAFAREGYRKSDFRLRDAWETLMWPGFRSLARKYWRTGLGEFRRSLSKSAFVTALQRLIPDINSHDLTPGGAGVRAQACGRNGALLDDFTIVENGNVIHVCNAPSPAATASFAIGRVIAESALSRLN